MPKLKILFKEVVANKLKVPKVHRMIRLCESSTTYHKNAVKDGASIGTTLEEEQLYFNAIKHPMYEVGVGLDTLKDHFHELKTNPNALYTTGITTLYPDVSEAFKIMTNSLVGAQKTDTFFLRNFYRGQVEMYMQAFVQGREDKLSLDIIAGHLDRQTGDPTVTIGRYSDKKNSRGSVFKKK